MDSSDIKTMVRTRYGNIAVAETAGCCAPATSCCVPSAAPDLHGKARQMGYSDGRVIGIDMTHEMLAKARGNAARIGAANVEFRLGELEHLPVADNTADVILSNCVINLVPDKPQVFREAFRVLKSGGRLAISDVVNTARLSEDLKSDLDLICGCVSGAAPAEQIENWLAAAGFHQIQVTIKPESREMIAAWAPGRGVEDHVASATIEAHKP